MSWAGSGRDESFLSCHSRGVGFSIAISKSLMHMYVTPVNSLIPKADPGRIISLVCEQYHISGGET